MPTYCFKCDCGQTKGVFRPISRRPKTVLCPDCGADMERDYHAEQVCPPPPSNWPMVSDFAGVHPDQIPEAQAALREHGVTADYTPDGSIVFRSRGHRARCLRALDTYDRDGGYSD
jgi:hypothetical protein